MNGDSWRAMMPVMAAALASAAAFGGLLPTLTLRLEAEGHGESLIGLMSGLTSVGVLGLGVFVPRLARRIPTADLMIGGMVLWLIAVPGLWLTTQSLGQHGVMRVVLGMGLVGQWLGGEGWLNARAPEGRRGLVLGAYATALATGFALGPALASVYGAQATTTLGLLLVATLLAGLPVVPVRRHSPVLAGEGHGRLALLAAAPLLFLAAFLGGFGEMTAANLMPLAALKQGLSHHEALLTLTAFAVGNMILQIPLGWTVDRLGPRRVLALLALVTVAGALVLEQALALPLVGWPVLVVWGGAVFGLYTVAIIGVGHRFALGALAGANTLAVLSSETGGVIGPTLTGVAMDLFPHWGFWGVFVVAGGLVLGLALLPLDGASRGCNIRRN